MAYKLRSATRQTREDVLRQLGPVVNQSTRRYVRKIFTRDHFAPGQIINAPLHSPNVEKGGDTALVLSTHAAGPVFSKRRYMIVLWKFFNRVICLPIYTHIQRERLQDFVSITKVSDEGWKHEATWCGTTQLHIMDTPDLSSGKLERSYVDLTFPIRLDMREDINTHCGFITQASYLYLVRLYRYKEQSALNEALQHPDLRDIQRKENLSFLALTKGFPPPATPTVATVANIMEPPEADESLTESSDQEERLISAVPESRRHKAKVSGNNHSKKRKNSGTKRELGKNNNGKEAREDKNGKIGSNAGVSKRVTPSRKVKKDS